VRRCIAVVACLGILAGCHQEDRRFREIPPGASPTGVIPEGQLHAGGPATFDSTISAYSDNAYAVSQGQRLYASMNCVGCHFHGGGGIGPPLMDDEWIYGSDPAQIFRTIVEGRPNGMPSYAGKLTNQQIWQVVAYVRTLSGLSGSMVVSSREDHMYLSPDLQIRPKEALRGQTIPPP
jgi:cytochrome c oxidase cbb3-type subunit 3